MRGRARNGRAIPRLAVLVLVALGGTASAESADRVDRETRRPNIVMIVADDLGATDLGFMGSPHVRSPQLDRLAAEGIVFRNGYSTASICRPALRSLLTGLYPFQWNARVRELARDGIRRTEPDRIQDFQTLPALLGEAGYATYQAGKFWERDHALAGFSAGLQAEGAGMANVGSQGRFIGRSLPLDPIFDFVDAQAGRPFFLFFTPMLPHTPHDALEFRPHYEGQHLARRTAWYYANVSKFDAVVGELVSGLERRGLRERTLLVFLSDNGWDQGPHFQGGATLMDGPRGKKSAHEKGHHTPILLAWPGVIPAGRSSELLVSSVDLFPTLLDYAGVERPAGLPGYSLRPVVERGADWPRRRVIGWSRDVRVEAGPAAVVPKRRGANRAYHLREGDWWYIWYQDRGVDELYDLSADPECRQDRAGAEPARVAVFRKAVLDWADEVLMPYREGGVDGSASAAAESSERRSATGAIR